MSSTELPRPRTPRGHPHGGGPAFVMDRMVDRLARTVGIDPAEARRRNFIRSDEMPYDVGMLYRGGNPLVYDGGDFDAILEASLEASGYRAIRDEQAALRGRGVYRGVGISRTWRVPASAPSKAPWCGSSAERFAREAMAAGVRLATRCRQAASLINSAHRSPERPDDSRPAGAGHPHVPAVGAAVELAATPMLLKEGVQVVKQAGHGRQCSSEGGRGPWVVIWRTRGSRA